MMPPAYSYVGAEGTSIVAVVKCCHSDLIVPSCAAGEPETHALAAVTT